MNSLFTFLDFSGKDFLSIGSFTIKFYAVCILIGILMAYFLGVKEAKRLGIPKYKITDGLLFCVPLAIIGARLYYVIFDANDSFHSLKSIIDIRNGGLAIMGAVIVAIIFVIVYCRIRKLPIFSIFDLLAPGLLIGQVCGRWGNWFNGEAHGGLIQSESLVKTYNTIFPWLMKKMSTDYAQKVTSADVGYYHPTFLYEGSWNLLGLIIMLILRRKSKHLKAGDFIGFYMVWYGFGRALLIEPFRTDQLKPVLGIPINILIPAIMAVLGLIFLILKHTWKKLDQPHYLDILNNVIENKIDTVLIRLDEDSYTNKVKITHFFKKLFKKKINVLIYSKNNKFIVEKMLEENKIKEYVTNYQEDLKTIDSLVNPFDSKNVLIVSSNINDFKNRNYKCCYFERKENLEKAKNVDFKESNFDNLIDDILFI